MEENDNSATTNDGTNESNSSTDAIESREKIDKMIAAAKARREAKLRAAMEAQGGGETSGSEETSTDGGEEETGEEKKTEKKQRARITDAEREARELKEKADRETRRMEKEKKNEERKQKLSIDKAARDEARAQRRAEREAKRAERENRKSHMGRVELAKSRLPAPDDQVSNLLESIFSSNLTQSQLSVLAAHVAHSVRATSTVLSGSVELKVGQRVEIVSSERDARLIGLVGTLSEVHKIRCLVNVEGRKRDAYVFCSDVRVVEEPTVQEPEASTEVTEQA